MKTNMKSWGIFEKAGPRQRAHLLSHLPSEDALCANFETKKITTVAGCLSIDAKMWQ